jgi:hypothetical protein
MSLGPITHPQRVDAAAAAGDRVGLMVMDFVFWLGWGVLLPAGRHAAARAVARQGPTGLDDEQVVLMGSADAPRRMRQRVKALQRLVHQAITADGIQSQSVAGGAAQTCS